MFAKHSDYPCIIDTPTIINDMAVFSIDESRLVRHTYGYDGDGDADADKYTRKHKYK